MTAFTLIETLSRVMTSWGGTSMATVRKLTFTILSMMGTRSTSPGPCPVPPGLKMDRADRPRRKITARSYSRRMRAKEPMMKKTARMRTISSNASTVIMAPLPGYQPSRP
jgi:hypothetical protein